MTLLVCIGDPVRAQSTKKKKSSGFPTLEMLPEGSILNEVAIPRYDKDFRPLSFLKADSMVVVEKSIIKTKNAYLEIYDKDGKVKMKTRMKRANFNQKQSILKSTHKTVLEGSTFKAVGTGLTIHETSQQGFLHGPCTTTYFIPNQQTSTDMNLKKMTKPLSTSAKKVATGVAITAAAAGTLIAERPPALTDAEVQQLDKQALPIKEEVTILQDSVITKIKEDTKADNLTDGEMQEFFKKTGKESVISTDPKIKESNTKGFDLPFPEAPEDQETLTIDSLDGLYFDAKKGVLVYIKDIKLTTSDYKLSCSDDLKFYIDPPKGGEHSEDKSGLASTDKINRIVATGDVVFIGTDAKGNSYIARAAEAHYDAKTETMILRGGHPSIQQSANQYLKSKHEDGYISIPVNGNPVTSHSAWETKIVIPKK